MTTEQAIELIKQGLAHLNKDWNTTVKLVEAVQTVENALNQPKAKSPQDS